MSDQDRDDSAPQPEHAGPSEVVSPGGPTGATGDAPSAPGRRPVARSTTVVRVGLALLATLGAITVYFGISTTADPERAICAQARAILEDQDEDLDADDVPCDDAIVRAQQVEDETLNSESAVRTTGVIATIIGAVQFGSALVVMRTRNRTARTVALVTCALGIVFPVLGYVSMAVLLFVVYAIYFSAASRAVFGEPRFLRPRA